MRENVYVIQIVTCRKKSIKFIYAHTFDMTDICWLCKLWSFNRGLLPEELNY